MTRVFRRAICLGVAFAAAVLPAAAEPQSFETKRADGSTIHWSLDRPDGDRPVGIVVLAQGSGCLPAMKSAALLSARSVFRDYAALAVEKYGVSPSHAPQNDTLDCPDTFYEHATLSQRVEDYVGVLDALSDEAWWNGDLVLFGGSEGGLVMGTLAGRVEANAAVLISTGAGATFGEIVRSGIPPEGWPTVDAVFEEVRNNPESLERWGGYTYRFWADAIDRRVADDMLQSDTAFLLIQGGRDPVPSEISRAASDLFAEAERCNLTYWEFPGYDHAMSDRTGASHMEAVIAEARQWVDWQMAGQEC